MWLVLVGFFVAFFFPPFPVFFNWMCVFACFQRVYDLLSGTTVWGMGPVFKHQAVADNAWPPGTEQG